MFWNRLVTIGLIIIVFSVMGIISSRIAWMQAPLHEAYNRSNLIRLHVIANSDSPQDQTVKLKVRDRIIKVTEPFLGGVEDPNKAEEVLLQKLDFLKETVQDELAKNGQEMPVTVSFGKFSFPERVYPFGTLPAGEYKGVRVILGEGEGKNWWCVLYPPLCLLVPDAPAFKGTAGENPKVQYHLAILEKMVQAKGLTMNQFWEGWGNFFGLL